MKKLFFAFLLIALSACHKTAPEEEVILTPAFSIKGSLNGNDFDFTPGVDGRYMFTDHQVLGEDASRFETVIQGIDGSAPALSFTLFQGDENSSTEDLLLSLPNEEVSFEIDENDLSVYLQTDALDAEWTIEGEVYNSAQVQVPFDFPFSYTFVSLDDGCDVLTSVNYLLPNACGFEQEFNPIGFTINNDDLILSPPSIGGEFSLYAWQVNGEVFVQNSGEELSIQVPNELGSIEIILSGVDDVGVEYPLIQQATVFFGWSNFCSSPEISSFLGLENTTSLIIEFTDADGTTYKSTDSCFPEAPSALSFFDVLEVSDYENNENNQATKRITFNAQVELFNTQNPMEEPLLLNLNNASIAFAY